MQLGLEDRPSVIEELLGEVRPPLLRAASDADQLQQQGQQQAVGSSPPGHSAGLGHSNGNGSSNSGRRRAEQERARVAAEGPQSWRNKMGPPPPRFRKYFERVMANVEEVWNCELESFETFKR